MSQHNQPYDPNNLPAPRGTVKQQHIVDERIQVYGDPFLSHQAIGLVWEGLFRNRYHQLSQWLNDNHPELLGRLFPADLTAELLAGFKECRLARPTYHEDSADDAHNYINFTQDFRTRDVIPYRKEDK